MLKIRIIKKNGQPNLKFHEGGLHATTSTPQNKPIHASKIAAAKAGDYGAKGKKEVNFMQNVLTGKK